METYRARPPAQKLIPPVAGLGMVSQAPVPEPRVRPAAEQTNQLVTHDTTPVGLAAMMAYTCDIHICRTPVADGHSLSLWLPTPGLIESISDHTENMSTIDSCKMRDQGIKLLCS